MTARQYKTTWAAIADGARSLILVNEGTDRAPQLSLLAKDELENPPAREQGTDRPGRLSDAGSGRKSATEQTDWHQVSEDRFIADFAGRLNRSAERAEFDRLILAAPPKVLGQIRSALSRPAAERVVAEIHSDLTRHPVDDIERHIAKAMAG